MDRNIKLAFEEFPEIMSKKQVAEMLGVTERAVTYKVESGKLRAFRIGGTLRFSKQHILDSAEEVNPESNHD